MSYGEIDWPINPEIGRVYTSPFLRTWVWNGCGCEATCCPPASCDPIVDGITLGVTFNASFSYVSGEVTLLFLFNYVDDFNGYPRFQTDVYPGGAYFSVFAEEGNWVLYLIEGYTSQLVSSTEITGNYPIGIFPPGGGGETLEFICGQKYKRICVTLGQGDKSTSVYLYPLLSGGIDGDILGYTLPESEFFILSYGGQWILLDNESQIANLEGVTPPDYPEGTWSNVIGFTSITTTEFCECGFEDGIDLVLKFSDAGGIYYNIALGYDGLDDNGNPVFSLEVVPGFPIALSYNLSLSRWELYQSTQFIAWSNELYGSYGTEWNQGDPSSLDYLTTTCGATFPVLCMEVVGGDILQSNLITAGYSPGEANVFIPIEGDPIMWDGSQWAGALGPSSNVLITLPGSETTLPIGSWNIVDLNSPESVSSVTTTLGPCNFAG